MLPISLVAVLAAAVAAFVIGFLMHGPVAGKMWMRLADIHPTGKEKMADMLPQLFWNLVVNIVTAYGLAVVYLFASGSAYLGDPGLMTGIVCGIIVWAGFLVTSSSIEVIWMKRKTSLWLFESFSSFLVMVAMGAIIAFL